MEYHISPDASINQNLKGVGGWLLLFVIGQLVCRPVQTCRGTVESLKELQLKLAELFPVTAMIFTVINVLDVVMMFFGIAVAIALLKTGTPKPVKLAKIYLVCNPVVASFTILLVSLSDLPSELKSQVYLNMLIYLVPVTVASVIWFLYFQQSARVYVTYFADQSIYEQIDQKDQKIEQSE